MISLWVEDSRQNSDMQKKIIDDYKISEEIALDIENIDRISDLVKKQINILEELIDFNRGDREFNGDSIIARINKVTLPTFWNTNRLQCFCIQRKVKFFFRFKISKEIAC